MHATAAGRPCIDPSRPCSAYYDANFRCSACRPEPPLLVPVVPAPTCACDPSSSPSTTVTCRKQDHTCHYDMSWHSSRPLIVAGKSVDKGLWRGTMTPGQCTGLSIHHSIRTTHPVATGFVDGHADRMDTPVQQHHCKMISSSKCACCDCTPPPLTGVSAP